MWSVVEVLVEVLPRVLTHWCEWSCLMVLLFIRSDMKPLSSVWSLLVVMTAAHSALWFWGVCVCVVIIYHVYLVPERCQN